MAGKNSTSRTNRRTALFLVLTCLPAILLAVVEASAQRPRIDLGDRFFKPQVYEQLRSGTFDAGLIWPQYAGVKLYRKQLAVVALERFIQVAADRGIPEKEITKAIFEGRLNPDFDDLELAWEALAEGQGSPSSSSGLINVALHNSMSQRWNSRFGSIADVGTVKTIVNGKEVSRTGNDLLLRLVRYEMVNNQVRDFPRELVLGDLTYDQMISTLQPKDPAKVEWLKQKIQNFSGVESAYSYFERFGVRVDYDGKVCCEDTRMRKDYHDLRAQLYARSSPPPAPPAAPEARKPALPDAAEKAPVTRPVPPASPKNATCDSLAAHPDDKGRMGPGVADEALAPDLAIERCTSAVKAAPRVARFHFQLGRAYWAAKRYDEALDALLKAEELNYAPAYFYLGQAFEKGLIEGQQADPETARQFYMIAASEGFAPAVRAYQGDSGAGAPVIDFSEFKQPALLQALYEGNLDALLKDRPKTISYIMGIYAFLHMSRDAFPPNEYDETCSPQADPEVRNQMNRIGKVEMLGLDPDATLLGSFADLSRKGYDSNFLAQLKVWETVATDGTDDFYLFVYDYGTCEGEAAQRVYATIKRFVMEHPVARTRSRNQ
jgi:tetratricopeptide (TPR) repeat protein